MQQTTLQNNYLHNFTTSSIPLCYQVFKLTKVINLLFSVIGLLFIIQTVASHYIVRANALVRYYYPFKLISYIRRIHNSFKIVYLVVVKFWFRLNDLIMKVSQRLVYLKHTPNNLGSFSRFRVVKVVPVNYRTHISILDSD